MPMTPAQILTDLWPVILLTVSGFMYLQRRQTTGLLKQVNDQAAGLKAQDNTISKLQNTSISTITKLQQEYQSVVSRQAEAVAEAVKRETDVQQRLLDAIDAQTKCAESRNKETEKSNLRMAEILGEFSRALGLTVVTQEATRQFSEQLTLEIQKFFPKLIALEITINEKFEGQDSLRVILTEIDKKITGLVAANDKNCSS